jgi:hypothetical protein
LRNGGRLKQRRRFDGLCIREIAGRGHGGGIDLAGLRAQRVIA